MDARYGYDPRMGDAPGYNLDTRSCAVPEPQRNAIVPLYGDENIWWVFNDKGNTHTETRRPPIGMESWPGLRLRDER